MNIHDRDIRYRIPIKYERDTVRDIEIIASSILSVNNVKIMKLDITGIASVRSYLDIKRHSVLFKWLCTNDCCMHDVIGLSGFSVKLR